MHRRNIVIALLALAAASTPMAAQPQQAVKVPRIGYLSGGSAEIGEIRIADFLQGLKDLGYVEGKTVLIERRYAAGRTERLPALAAELVRLKVDVLVAIADPAALAAKTATGTIPIVAHAADPVGIGLVASLARPGGNVTGLSDLHADLIPKRLELLKQLVPSASRAAFLVNPANPTCSLQLRDLQAAAPALGMTILSVEAKGVDDFERVSGALRKERVAGLLVCGDPTLATYRKQIFEIAARTRLPAIYTNSGWVEAGGLMSYGANFPDLFRRLATYVDKILKGARPADLPVEQPTKFELVINLKTARALGIKSPQSVLLRADRAIE